MQAKKEELALLDAFERKSKAILATEQLALQNILARIKSTDRLRSISEDSEFQQTSLRRKIPIAQLESQIASAPFATPQQEYDLLRLRNQARIEEETSAIAETARKRQKSQVEEFKSTLLTSIDTLGYLGQSAKNFKILIHILKKIFLN